MTQRTASRGRESSHRIPRRDEQVVGGGRKPNPGCGARGGAASQAPPRHRQVSGAARPSLVECKLGSNLYTSHESYSRLHASKKMGCNGVKRSCKKTFLPLSWWLEHRTGLEGGWRAGAPGRSGAVGAPGKRLGGVCIRWFNFFYIADVIKNKHNAK